MITIREQQKHTVGLLGTRFTMEEDLYRGRLKDIQGISVLGPAEEDMDLVHSVMYEELCKGIIRDESRRGLVRIIEELASRGAEGVVLGCTEIPLLIVPGDVSIPVYDTTSLHVEYTLREAL